MTDESAESTAPDEAVTRTSAELTNAFAQAFQNDEDSNPPKTDSIEEQAASLERTESDRRLYAVKPAETQVHVKRTWDREYCFAKNSGEDYFHLLVCGEFYVEHGEEQFCLNCAIRRKLITIDRENWKNGF